MKKSSKVILVIIIILIIAIIGVGGWYLVINLNKSNERIAELENQIIYSNEENAMAENKNSISTVNSNKISNEIATNDNISNESKTYTYSDVKGTYTCVRADSDPSLPATMTLKLCDSGTFAYYYDGYTDCHYEGYYTVNNNTIVLNCIVDCANDPSRTIINKAISMTINSDGSLKDSVVANSTLKKFSSTVDEKIYISETISGALKNNFLSSEN